MCRYIKHILYQLFHCREQKIGELEALIETNKSELQRLESERGDLFAKVALFSICFLTGARCSYVVRVFAHGANGSSDRSFMGWTH